MRTQLLGTLATTDDGDGNITFQLDQRGDADKFDVQVEATTGSPTFTWAVEGRLSPDLSYATLSTGNADAAIVGDLKMYPDLRIVVTATGGTGSMIYTAYGSIQEDS